MIQRIQSLYLLLAAFMAGGLVFFLNLWTGINGDVWALDLFMAESFLQKATPVLFFLSALLSIVGLFLFKNRELQFVVGRLNILTNLILLSLLVYLSLTLPGEATVSEKGIGMFIPIIVILVLVFANKAIKKDEDLVKSVDRLR